MIKKAYLLICCSFLFLNGIAQEKFIRDSLDVYVNREMKRWNIPGVSVAVVKDGKVIVTKGYGIREFGKNDPVDENTLFQVASNSKAFTGTALALLAHQHKLSLDDKASKWLKDFQLKDELASRETTVRDLLCHRIGFETFQSDFLNWDCNLSRAELIRNMRNVNAVYGFRSHYGYNNVAFLAAGEVIPAVTDTSWDDYLKYHFLLPLGMSRSSTHFKQFTEDANIAKAHTLFEHNVMVIPYANVDNIGPAASLNSSAKDMANWLLMQLDSGKFAGKTVVPFPALRETWTSQTIIRDVNGKGKHFNTYGLGWVLEDYEGRKVISHTGGANGFVTSTCFLPEERLGIVVLTNSDVNGLFVALRQQIIDATLRLPYQNHSFNSYKRGEEGNKKNDQQQKEYKNKIALKNKPERSLQEYAGTYFNPVYGKIDIKLEKGQLIIYFEHHPQLTGKLECLEGNNFLCSYYPVTYGIRPVSFSPTTDPVIKITLTVDEFIDRMPYEFVKQQ